MRGLLRLLLSLHDGLTRLSFAAAVLALVVVTGSYIYEVVARYFFRAPTTWSSDVVGYALCASIFLGLPMVTSLRRLVAVTVVLEAVPTPTASLLNRLIDLLGTLACAAAGWFSLNENLRQYAGGIMTLANDPIPKWLITGLITFGLLLSSLHFLRRLLRPDNLAPVQAPAGLD